MFDRGFLTGQPIQKGLSEKRSTGRATVETEKAVCIQENDNNDNLTQVNLIGVVRCDSTSDDQGLCSTAEDCRLSVGGAAIGAVSRASD